MKEELEYDICSKELLAAYQLLKDNVLEKNVAICQHIGSFSQDILISIVSLIERSLTQNGESILLQKRLTYLIIESIQNIIYHSENLGDMGQLAYIFISKTKTGYTIHASNSIRKEHAKGLESKLRDFLDIKRDLLSKLFASKIQNPIIDTKGSGGVGLLTMINKSGKGFKYEIKEVSKNYAIFRLELKINYKNFR